MIPLKDENPTTRTPVLTIVLLVVNVGVFLGFQQSDAGTEDALVFNLERAAIPCEVLSGEPLSVREIDRTFLRGDVEACNPPGDESPIAFPDKSVWLAVLTSMFLHGDLMHLGFNMLFLWIFGNNIEDHLGLVKFGVFYAVGGIVATIAHVVAAPDSTVPLVGASGAIAAVMGAYLVWFPEAPIRTMVGFWFFIVDIRAKWLLSAWFILQFFTSPNAGVAWMAHVGGFVFGVVIGLLVRASRSAQHAMWSGGYADRSGPWDATGGTGVDPYRGGRRDPSQRRFGGRDW